MQYLLLWRWVLCGLGRFANVLKWSRFVLSQIHRQGAERVQRSLIIHLHVGSNFRLFQFLSSLEVRVYSLLWHFSNFCEMFQITLQFPLRSVLSLSACNRTYHFISSFSIQITTKSIVALPNQISLHSSILILPQIPNDLYGEVIWPFKKSKCEK